jgi:hypothetical protein
LNLNVGADCLQAIRPSRRPRPGPASWSGFRLTQIKTGAGKNARLRAWQLSCIAARTPAIGYKVSSPKRFQMTLTAITHSRALPVGRFILSIHQRARSWAQMMTRRHVTQYIDPGLSGRARNFVYGYAVTWSGGALGAGHSLKNALAPLLPSLQPILCHRCGIVLRSARRA